MLVKTLFLVFAALPIKVSAQQNCSRIFAAPTTLESIRTDSKKAYQIMRDFKQGKKDAFDLDKPEHNIDSIASRQTVLWLASVVRMMEAHYFEIKRISEKDPSSIPKQEDFNSIYHDISRKEAIALEHFFNLTMSNDMSAYSETYNRKLQKYEPAGDLLNEANLIFGYRETSFAKKEFSAVDLLVRIYLLKSMTLKIIQSKKELGINHITRSRSYVAPDHLTNRFQYALSRDTSGRAPKKYGQTHHTESHSFNHFSGFNIKEVNPADLSTISRRNRATTVLFDRITPNEILSLTEETYTPNMVSWVKNKAPKRPGWKSKIVDLKLYEDKESTRFLISITTQYFVDQQKRVFEPNDIVSIVPLHGPNVYRIPDRQTVNKQLKAGLNPIEIITHLPDARSQKLN